MSVTSEYRVSGMTCGHCVQAVTDEVSALPGVETVNVELTSGVVTVTSDVELSTDDVAAAVDEAGYQLTP